MKTCLRGRVDLWRRRRGGLNLSEPFLEAQSMMIIRTMMMIMRIMRMREGRPLEAEERRPKSVGTIPGSTKYDDGDDDKDDDDDYDDERGGTRGEEAKVHWNYFWKHKVCITLRWG